MRFRPRRWTDRPCSSSRASSNGRDGSRSCRTPTRSERRDASLSRLNGTPDRQTRPSVTRPCSVRDNQDRCVTDSSPNCYIAPIACPRPTRRNARSPVNQGDNVQPSRAFACSRSPAFPTLQHHATCPERQPATVTSNRLRRQPAVQQATPSSALPFAFSGVLYLNYQYGGPTNANSANRFDVDRAYLNFRASAGSRDSIRVTARCLPAARSSARRLLRRLGRARSSTRS